MRIFRDRRDAAAVLLIVGAFIATRSAFYLLGGRYIATPLNFAMQYLDPQLLQHDLLQSLVYLHAQPPGFNLFLGAMVKFAGGSAAAFAATFMAAGVLALLCLYGLVRAAGLGRWAAALVVLLYLLNPTVLLYENLLYYSYAESVLIIAAAWLFYRWCLGPRLDRALCFWAAMGCLGAVRSVFHPVFFITFLTVTAAILYLKRTGGRHILLFCAASLVAIVPLGLLVAKNRALYGFWGTSSWEGMNLWTKACGYGPEELEQLHRSGVISSLGLQAELEPFRALDQYDDGKMLLATPCHHQADCAAYKSTGKPNYNHAGYAALSRSLRQDGLALIANDPGRFAFQTLASYSLTLWHASDSVHGLFHDNMELLEPLEKAYRFAYFGFLGVRDRFSDPRIWIRTALVTCLLVLAYGAAAVRLIRSSGGRDTASALLLFFCSFMHAFVIAVSSVIEFGENNRFRFPVDGALIILLAGAVSVFSARKSTGANSSFPASTPSQN